MPFKEFITRQRVAILIIGMATFIVSLILAHAIDFKSLWGSLFIDLAASAVTIIFTALIIDYLGMKEQSIKTQNAAELAEDEINVTCAQIKWRLARLFGLKRDRSARANVSTREEAREYLNEVTSDVDTYLMTHDMASDKTPLDESRFVRYTEGLETAQNELEQMLLLYEYALSYTLRERILALRRELQVASRILGFIDTTEEMQESNISLIRVTSKSIYAAIIEVLYHESRSSSINIHSKDSAALE
jgi:hypothetical protein